MSTKKWSETPATVTLTNEQWNRLEMYINMTAGYREKEAEAWESLVTEKKEDGTPKFPHAADNARFWRELHADMKTIKETIEKR